MFGIEKDFQKLMEQAYGPLGEKQQMTEIEKTKKEIEVLTAKLALLEEMENHKTPCEIAYKDWWGIYPELENDTEYDDTRWQGFQAGYHFAYEEKVKETAQERGERLHKDVERVVKESVKWCEEHPDESVEDWLKPQHPEQVADGLKKAFREAVKQGVVSSVDKRQTPTKSQSLYDICMTWWERVFDNNDDMETCIDDLVDNIDYWLPKEHDTNSYKWNQCIRMIREKLR